MKFLEKYWMYLLGGAAAYYFLVMKKKQVGGMSSNPDAVADGIPDPDAMGGCNCS